MFDEDEEEAIELIKQYRKEIKDGDIKPIFILDTAINLITKLQKENKEKDNNIEELKSKNKYLKLENEAYGKTIVEQDEKIKQKDKYIKHSEDITKEMRNDINKLLLEIKEKDNKVRKIINRLNNDIFRISKSKESNKWDDYRRCRLKSYKTKTREIKEYIEQEYFEKKAKENNK